MVEGINQMASEAESSNAADEVELIGLRWIVVAALLHILVGLACAVLLDQHSPYIVMGILVLTLLDHRKRRPLYIRKDAGPAERARTIAELSGYGVAAALLAVLSAWMIDYLWP